MRLRLLAAGAAVLLFAGLAPAQWAIAPAARQPPVSGLSGTLLVYAGYPSGWAAGYDYGRMENGVKTPAGGWLPCPVPGGRVRCVSAAGVYAAGAAGETAFRWHLGSGEVEVIGPNLSGVGPVAVADDGAVVVTAGAGGWLVGGVVHPGRTAAVVVPCQYGYLAPQWELHAADSIEPAGGGRYVVRGGGSRGGFVLTGPLPE